MFLIIVAALLGFTGRGGLAGINKMTAETPSQSMKIEYNRFLRNQVSDEMKISVQSSNPTILFSKDFQENVRVEQIVPEPESVETSAAGISYTFKAKGPESRIVFYIKPANVGPLNTTVHGPSNAIVALSQFVYP